MARRRGGARRVARLAQAGPLRPVDNAVEREALLVVSDPAEWAPIDLASSAPRASTPRRPRKSRRPALAPGAVVLSRTGSRTWHPRARLPGGVRRRRRRLPRLPAGGARLGRPPAEPRPGQRAPAPDLLAGGGVGAPGRALAAVAAAVGVPSRIDQSYEAALWTKLVANAALNTVTTLGRVRVGRSSPTRARWT